jgi:predicted SAM-dependent methyltransferase
MTTCDNCRAEEEHPLKNGNSHQEYKELLIGCGNRREKEMGPLDQQDWCNLVTLDMNESCDPDVVWDLNDLPYPFDNNHFNEIHAYDVLEHTGKQGDYKFFFQQFTEFWRILKPDGLLLITIPHWNSIWAWGDPGHTRVLAPGCFHYLSQNQYARQLGITKMTDYRNIYKADFEVLKIQEVKDLQQNVYLRAIKEG